MFQESTYVHNLIKQQECISYDVFEGKIGD